MIEVLRLEHSLYGAESWTLRKVDLKYLGSFEMWCWRRKGKISWTNIMRNESCCIVKKEMKSCIQ
jgi:hypothetical protein